MSGLFRRNIWIIGSSIIAKAEKHTTQRPTGKNIGLDKNGLNVVWAGIPGMKISALVPLVQAMVNCFGFPHALVIHCRSNDIGMGSIREVLKHLIYATFIVSKMLPNSLLIYSQILPRKWCTLVFFGEMTFSLMQFNVVLSNLLYLVKVFF
jgi:hypothetical protein